MEGTKVRKTTKRDFRVFQEEVEKWLSFFGLSGWNFAFFPQKIT